MPNDTTEELKDILSKIQRYRQRAIEAKGWKDQEAGRREVLAEAICLAHRIEKCPATGAIFDLEAVEHGAREPNGRGSPYLRILDYFGLELPPPTAARYCHVIRRCLEFGWSRAEIRQVLREHGPMYVLKRHQL